MTTHPNPGEIIVRLMTPADLPQVEALDQACFSDPWPRGAFSYELRPDSNSLCLVARDSSSEQEPIVGVVVTWLIVDEVHIGTLAVSPGYRGLGIARRLLASALLRASKNGAVKSLLEVRAGNNQALKLYFGMGYEAVGLRPGYYENNHEDALLLTLDPIDIRRMEALI